MVERREIITLCRQIGIMMQAGVDFLQITHVLRAQTENPRLLSLYDALDHDLRMGSGIADAMARAPDIFSPFAVSLVRQVEMRMEMGQMGTDLGSAFLKVADFLQQDATVPRSTTPKATTATSDGVSAATQSPTDSAPQPVTSPALPQLGVLSGHLPHAAPLTAVAVEQFIARLQRVAWRAVTALAGLLFTLAGISWSVEVGLLERRWLNAALYLTTALFMGGVSAWIWWQGKAQRETVGSCSFCGQQQTSEHPLQSATHLDGAAICSQCAALIAQDITASHVASQNADAAIPGSEENKSINPEANAGVHNHYAETNRAFTSGADFDYDELVESDSSPREPQPSRVNWADMRRREQQSDTDYDTFYTGGVGEGTGVANVDQGYAYNDVSQRGDFRRNGIASSGNGSTSPTRMPAPVPTDEADFE